LVEYLITGCSGFVGSHYLAFLAEKEDVVSVVGIGSSPPQQVSENLEFEFKTLNLLDANKLSALIEAVRPRYCIHLASMSSVAESWDRPAESFVNNTNIFLNLVESIRQKSPETRLLSIGSSEQYGPPKNQKKPLVESDVLRPESPYAVARCAQESLASVYVQSYGAISS
jgi:GDP-4-dehydro-6-deoxy-D-mannose reductase